jgi:poly(A) polymerase
MRDNRYGKLEEDVVRRDFNMNALYYDVHKQEVIDYVGCHIKIFGL